MDQSKNFRVFKNPFISVLALVFVAGVLAFSLWTMGAKPASASMPATIGYQGRLKNTAGTAQTGTFSFTFRLYNDLTLGSAMWSETQTLAVSDGFVTAQLGASTTFPVAVDFNQPMYFTVEVGSDGEMSPRVPIGSVAYAYTAGGIASLSSVAAASATGGRMFYDTTNGALNYYDGITATWRNLRQGTVTSTFQQVTDAGNVTTNAIQFAGGTSTASFVASSDLTVLGSASLQALIFTNGTATSVTTTNFFASSAQFTNISGVTNLSGTGLVFSNATFTNVTTTALSFGTASGTTLNASEIFVNGSAVCLANGTSCPAATSNDTLAIVSARGSSATTTLQLYGGFVGSSSTVTSTFTVLGNTILQALTGTNATLTNATTTNLYASNAVSSTSLFANTGTIGSLTAGTVTISAGTINGTTIGQSVAAAGSFTTLTASGNTGLQALTATDVTTTNATTTALSFGTASGTTLNASNIFVNGSAVCLQNATNCPAFLTFESDTLATVSARGSSATTTLQLFGGFVGSSSTVTSTFTVLGNTNLQGLTGTNATLTNATTTNLGISGLIFAPTNNSVSIGTASNSFANIYASGTVFAVNHIGTNGTFTNGLFTNATATNATATNLGISGLIFPATNNTVSIGTASNSFANIYASGTVFAVNHIGTNATFTNATTPPSPSARLQEPRSTPQTSS